MTFGVQETNPNNLLIDANKIWSNKNYISNSYSYSRKVRGYATNIEGCVSSLAGDLSLLEGNCSGITSSGEELFDLNILDLNELRKDLDYYKQLCISVHSLNTCLVEFTEIGLSYANDRDKVSGVWLKALKQIIKDNVILLNDLSKIDPVLSKIKLSIGLVDKTIHLLVTRSESIIGNKSISYKSGVLRLGIGLQNHYNEIDSIIKEFQSKIEKEFNKCFITT